VVALVALVALVMRFRHTGLFGYSPSAR